MNVRLVIESAPHAQAVSERVFEGGRLVIGRSDDADWQLNDPDMFVSRQHCILTEEAGRVMATDASSGGLFIDNAANPVGSGNSVPVEPGMRLRLGDFVLRIEAVTVPARAPEPAPQKGGMSFDFNFGAPDPAPEPVERPASLPDPFGLSTDSRSHERRRTPEPPRPLDQEDPFGLDLRSPFEDRTPVVAPADSEPRRGGAGGYFGGGGAPSGDRSDDTRLPEPPAPRKDLFASWDAPVATPAPEPAPDPDPEPDTIPEPVPVPAPPPPEVHVPEPAPAQVTPPSPVSAADADLRTALLRSMGLDPDRITGDSTQQMEQIGKSMRALVEGVMLLLRTRAQAKQKARVAQTIIASADVNPLKFLATPEDALAAMIALSGKSYLDADAAVNEAFRDLTDHQVRTWAALQTALRRMIDKFDPQEVEKEMEDIGLLESLIAGGRSAKLWQLYEGRYREIAEAAEQEFLGEVGADFRDAYENER
ncbi:type VI secretion system-associated FHA domain protein TagH [Litorisediminicola beolgyonensis]|uniref:Type VI secretion system-associated FHA domain protein TagH n=1 Tax=Litorisediminicola beolgyonensis TaxID=1173614 RepID=A0ABW3ZKN6_9RHOB